MIRSRPDHFFWGGAEIVLLYTIQELQLPGCSEICPHGRVGQREQKPDGTQNHPRDGSAAFGIGVDAQNPEDQPGNGHRSAADGQQPGSQAE